MLHATSTLFVVNQGHRTFEHVYRHNKKVMSNTSNYLIFNKDGVRSDNLVDISAILLGLSILVLHSSVFCFSCRKRTMRVFSLLLLIIGAAIALAQPEASAAAASDPIDISPLPKCIASPAPYPSYNHHHHHQLTSTKQNCFLHVEWKIHRKTMSPSKFCGEVEQSNWVHRVGKCYRRRCTVTKGCRAGMFLF